MKAIVRLCVLMCVAAPASAFAQVQPPQPFGLSGIRLASFSPQRAFSESEEGKIGLARLTALRNERGRQIEERNRALQAREQKALTVPTDDTRAQLTKELERFRIDTERLIQDVQAELLGIQREIEGAFVARLTPALQHVAKDKGLQLVVNLDDPTIVWADPALDITADVLKQLARAELPGNR